jgi:hypothetical protein
MTTGFDVLSCPDVVPGTLRLVSIDGSTRTITLGAPIEHDISWRRFEMSPEDYVALSRQIRLG